MRKRFRRLFGGFEKIRHSKAVGWLGPRLHDPRVWHMSREGVARGFAVGLFFGFLVPLAQIPVAAIFAILLRANLAVAVGSTLVTNPFTFAPVYFLAYRIGAWMLGLPPGGAAEETFAIETSEMAHWPDIWSQRIMDVGKPLFLGLLTLAVTSATAAYALVLWVWRIAAMRAWQRRNRARRPPAVD